MLNQAGGEHWALQHFIHEGLWVRSPPTFQNSLQRKENYHKTVPPTPNFQNWSKRMPWLMVLKVIERSWGRMHHSILTPSWVFTRHNQCNLCTQEDIRNSFEEQVEEPLLKEKSDKKSPGQETTLSKCFNQVPSYFSWR